MGWTYSNHATIQNILYKTLLSVGKVKDLTLRGRYKREDKIKMYLKGT